MFFRIYGKKPSEKRLERIKQSPNYKNNVFQNLSHTVTLAEDSSFFKIAKQQINKNKNVEPPKDIPFVKTDLKLLSSTEPTIVWFGHSSYFIRINNKNILVDPVLSGNAAPVSFMVKAFKGSNEYAAEDFPEIDLLILTHDHYDHLDYKTITNFKSKIKNIYCALGVGSHLEYWGLDSDIMTEFDWWDTHKFENEIEITATPARHFTGRGIKRAKTLWCSYVLKTPTHTLFLGGDSGYDHHFKTIGEKFGPFDMAILECGQYNAAWPQIHMMPEQTVQACVDLDAKVLFPVHWGKFTLAMHAWDEPITRLTKKAKELNVKVTTPLIGEPIVLNTTYPDKTWWSL